ncbi:hypothetical protein MIR68_011551 [Amoeboaphelidium protococcarum]|nr:hypothetical protein MIR68_011551 [Amoeboaphelidium protococcarum]
MYVLRLLINFSLLDILLINAWLTGMSAKQRHYLNYIQIDAYQSTQNLSPRLFQTPALKILYNSSQPAISENVLNFQKGVNAVGFLYLDDTTGCSVNKSYVTPSVLTATNGSASPSSSSQNINTPTITDRNQFQALILSRDGCSLEQKVNLSLSLDVDIVLVYDTKDSDSLDLDQYLASNGSVGFDIQNPAVPLVLVDFEVGNTILQYLQVSAKANPEFSPGLVKLIIAQDVVPTSPYGVIEFTLIVVVVLLALSFVASILMHCHLYRIRNQIRQRNMEQTQVDRQRHLLTQSEFNSLPTFFYKPLPGDCDDDNVDSYVNIKQDVGDTEMSPFQQQKQQLQYKRPQSDGEIDLGDYKSAASSKTALERSSSLRTIHHKPDDIRQSVIRLATNCSICIDDFEEGNELKVLQCGHVFHSDCLQPWLCEKSGVCPLCKLNIAQEFWAVRDTGDKQDVNRLPLDQSIIHRDRSLSDIEQQHQQQQQQDYEQRQQNSQSNNWFGRSLNYVFPVASLRALRRQSISTASSLSSQSQQDSLHSNDDANGAHRNNSSYDNEDDMHFTTIEMSQLERPTEVTSSSAMDSIALSNNHTIDKDILGDADAIVSVDDDVPHHQANQSLRI